MSRFIEIAMGNNENGYNICISLNNIVSIEPLKDKTEIVLTSFRKKGDKYQSDRLIVDMNYDAFIQGYQIVPNEELD
jgi:Pyruvate/2-oxoacid:ferredoxin oxidoreductase gamma subunit